MEPLPEPGDAEGVRCSICGGFRSERHGTALLCPTCDHPQPADG